MADTSDDYFSDKDYLPPGSPYLQSVLVNWEKGKKKGLSDELCSDDELDLVGAPLQLVLTVEQMLPYSRRDLRY